MKTMLCALMVLLFLGCSDDAPKQNEAVAEQKTEVVEQPEVVAEQEAIVEEDVIEPEVTTEEEALEEEDAVEIEAIQEIKEEVVADKKDVATLYKACAACHGADASKAALGKSQVIKGWSAQKIAEALNGYKDGTYGGATKALMTGQVAKLNQEDIETLSQYIAEF